MSKGLTSQTIKAIDDFTINEIGIPSMVLMERAALAIAQKLLEKDNSTFDTYAIVCGPGNNGGDGLAIGRLLHQADKTVAIYLVGDLDSASDSFKQQLRIALNLDIGIQPFDRSAGPFRADVILDAIFGIGLSRNVEEPHKTAIAKINQSKGHIISVDVPSGLSANTGQVMGTAVKANITYTIGFMKIGFERNDSTGLTGDVHVLDIGYPDDYLIEDIIKEELV